MKDSVAVEAAEVRPEEMDREAVVVAEMDREVAVEMDREVVAETDLEAEAETDREEAVEEAKVIAKLEAEVVEAGLTTTEDEVKDAKWLVAEINVTAGQETDVDVTTCKKNPTLYKLDGVETAAVAWGRLARVDTLTETSECEWMSQATTNRTAIKMIPTDMDTTKAMIKATIRATILLLVAGAVHPVEGVAEEDAVREAVVRAALLTEKVANKTPRVNLQKDNNNQREDTRMERVRTLPMPLPIILLLWWQHLMVVAAILVIVVAVEEEVGVAASTRVEPTFRVLLLPSHGSERRMAMGETEMPRAVVVEEKLKNKSSPQH
jgi:hypothetical protein